MSDASTRLAAALSDRYTIERELGAGPKTALREGLRRTLAWYGARVGA